MAGWGPELRAADADRAATVAQLQRHYTAGRLTLAELEERTEAAYAARTMGALEALLADLPPEATPPPGESDRRRGPRTRARGPLRSQFARFISVAALLIGVWALSGRGYFWPAWPLLAIGAGLVRRLLRGA
jgi:hypothetical protein